MSGPDEAVLLVETLRFIRFALRSSYALIEHARRMADGAQGAVAGALGYREHAAY